MIKIQGRSKHGLLASDGRTLQLGNIAKINYADFLRRAGIQQSSFIKSCTWERNGANCADSRGSIRQRLIYPFGNCYTVNADGQMFVTDVVFNRGVMINLTLDGLSQGTSEQLILGELNEYRQRNKEKNHFYMLLHHPNVEPNFLFKSKWTALMTKYKSRGGGQIKNRYSMSVRKVHVFQRLGKPYSKSDCVRNKKSHNYSSAACYLKCTTEIMIKRGHCILYDVPDLTQNLSRYLCDDRNNSNEKASEYRQKIIQNCRKECNAPCETWDFEVDVKEEIMKGRREYIHDQLHIYFKSLTVEKTEQVKGYTLFNMLSELGGYLGLLLGASFITVVHFVVFLLTTFWHCLNSRNRKTHVKPIK